MPLPEPGPTAITVTRVPCPACGEPFPWPPVSRCSRCGVDLTAPAASEVFDLDRRWAALAAERTEAVQRLVATRPAPAEQPGELEAARLAGTRAGTSSPDTRSVATVHRSGVPALLGLAGAALLTAAAIVFTAVAWTTLPALGKAAVLLAATGMSAAAALALHRRGTTIAAAAMGAVTMALALVDVFGADRTGLVDLGEFALPLGALVAAGVGAALARRGLGWVPVLGVLATAVGGVTLVAALTDVNDLPAPLTTLAGTVAAVGLAVSRPVWPDRLARLLARVGAAIGLTAAGIVSVVAIGEEGTTVVAGLAAVAVPVAVSVAALRWTPWGLLPATLLSGSAMVTTAVALGAEGFGVAAVAAGVVAAVAWAARELPQDRRRPVLLGLVPLALPVVAVAVMAAATSLRGMADAAPGRLDRVDPWAATTALLGATALLAAPAMRRWTAWILAATILMVSGAVTPTVAWIGLAGLAAVGALLAARLDAEALPPVLLAVAAVAWAADAAATTAITATWAVGVAAHAASRTEGRSAAVAIGTAVGAASLAVGTALRATTMPIDVCLGAGLLTALLLAAAIRAWPGATRPDLRHLAGDARDAAVGAAPIDTAVTGVAAVATVTGVAGATSDAAAGLLLLTAAVGWLAIAAAGWWPARWITSLVASLGAGVLLADAGVTTVEAYTILPALALGAVGLRWIERTEVRTMTALWPALAIGLGPSVVVLLAEPRALARTLLLALVAGAVATAGVQLRWLAPTVAGSVTAIGVALSQLTVAVEVLPRWVTFAVVGALLVWLAATYEQQQQRARAIGQHLTAYR